MECRTPLMVAKRDRLAKFMYDLTCDQETKQLLLTEADYSAACAIREEIATLQPLSKEETKNKLLNEWNIPVSDEEGGDEEEGGDNTSSLESDDGTEIENSNHTSINIERSASIDRSSKICIQETGVQVVTQGLTQGPATLSIGEVRKPAIETENDDGEMVDKCHGTNMGFNMSKERKSFVSPSPLHAK